MGYPATTNGFHNVPAANRRAPADHGMTDPREDDWARQDAAKEAVKADADFQREVADDYLGNLNTDGLAILKALDDLWTLHERQLAGDPARPGDATRLVEIFRTRKAWTDYRDSRVEDEAVERANAPMEYEA